MFGGGKIKLEATVTVDISKTKILLKWKKKNMHQCPSACRSTKSRPPSPTFGQAHHLLPVTSFCQSLISLTEVTAEALVAYRCIALTSWVSYAQQWYLHSVSTEDAPTSQLSALPKMSLCKIKSMIQFLFLGFILYIVLWTVWKVNAKFNVPLKKKPKTHMSKKCRGNFFGEAFISLTHAWQEENTSQLLYCSE